MKYKAQMFSWWNTSYDIQTLSCFETLVCYNYHHHQTTSLVVIQTRIYTFCDCNMNLLSNTFCGQSPCYRQGKLPFQLRCVFGQLGLLAPCVVVLGVANVNQVSANSPCDDASLSVSFPLAMLGTKEASLHMFT